MTTQTKRSTTVIYGLLFFLFGSLISASLAPYYLWPLSIVAIAFLLLGISRAEEKNLGRKIYLYATCFGLGQFLSGSYWVYISIHDQSNTPAIIAAPMTLLWGLFLSGFTVLFVYLFKKFSKNNGEMNHFFNILLAPALWVLVDLFRGWVFTGFPWLYLGHSQINTPLAGWVPLLGVQFLSFTLALIASTLVFVFQSKIREQLFQKIGLLVFIGLTFFVGQSLKSFSWVEQQNDKTISISLIQANIAQEEKWLPQFRESILQRYSLLLDKAIEDTRSTTSKSRLYIFPETALPDYLLNLETYLQQQSEKLTASNSGLLSGIVSYEPENRKVFNSIKSIGNTTGFYSKRHLVPFGEFMPFAWLRQLADFFNLPMSSFSSGADDQELFTFEGAQLAPFICYEIAYPNLVRKTAKQSDILLTVSNDTWFGKSSAPPQHMQIAQFRALENGRYLIRSTNNGITAIVNEKGKITQQLPQFEAGVLHADVPSFTGQTPYNRWGDWPITILCSLIALLGIGLKRVKL